MTFPGGGGRFPPHWFLCPLTGLHVDRLLVALPKAERKKICGRILLSS